MIKSIPGLKGNVALFATDLTYISKGGIIGFIWVGLVNGLTRSGRGPYVVFSSRVTRRVKPSTSRGEGSLLWMVATTVVLGGQRIVPMSIEFKWRVRNRIMEGGSSFKLMEKRNELDIWWHWRLEHRHGEGFVFGTKAIQQLKHIHLTLHGASDWSQAITQFVEHP